MIPKRKVFRKIKLKNRKIWMSKKKKQEDRIVLELMNEAKQYRLCG